MWRSSDTGELYFDDCRVPEENLLGKQGDGFHQMLSTLDNGRLAIAAMGLGGAQGAFELALKYAKTREQFGKPISTFQVNAFKLADMDTQIEAAQGPALQGLQTERRWAALPQACRHGEALLLRDDGQGGGRGRPDTRRLRPHEGIQH